MNNYFLLFKVILLLNCFINVNTKSIKFKRYELSESVQQINNNNNNSTIDDNSSKIYYDIDAIKKETKWSDISVQKISYTPNLLSLISQGPFPNLNKSRDTNFYYPSTAGKGIDIYLLDQGINVNHEDFNTYKNTEDERTITCDAIFSGKISRITSGEEKNKCTYDGDFPFHGMMVSSLAGGTLYGVAKKANIHMIAVDESTENIFKSFDYILEHGKPHKTVISMSFGEYGRYNKKLDDKLDELINKGFIIVSAAGNENINCCGHKSDDIFTKFAGYRKTITVGAATINDNGNGYMKADFSNYGECVDIFAPYEGLISYIKNDSTTDTKVSGGTSAAAPVVAGVIASIMSEHPEIEFDNETMRKTLIEMSIKDAIDFGHYGKNDSSDHKIEDTPNRFINNGKQKIYYPDNSTTVHCGGGKSGNHCSDGCCTKDGECISFVEHPGDKCFIENGCQSEFGYCTTKEKAIEDCEKELNENEECIKSFSEEKTLNQCLIMNSTKCKKFYENQLSDQSICSIAKKYKEFQFIDNFNMKRFSMNNYDCSKLLYDDKNKCKDYIETNYSNCMEEISFEFEYFTNEELREYDYFIQQCSAAKSCQNSLKNPKEVILNDSYCSYLYENGDTSIINDILNSLNQKKIELVLKKHEEFDEKCESILDKDLMIENCNKELEEYKECLLDTSLFSLKNSTTDELVEKCNSYTNSKCKHFYEDYVYYIPNCLHTNQINVKDLTKNIKEIDTTYKDICINNPSNEIKEKIIADCEKSISPCLFEYYPLMKEDEITSKCEIFRSKECDSNFYEIIESPSCNLASKIYGDKNILNYISIYRNNKGICRIYDDEEEKQEYIDLCISYLRGFEVCNLIENPVDDNDMETNCDYFINCQKFYEEQFDYDNPYKSKYADSCKTAQVFYDFGIMNKSSEKYKFYEEKCFPNNNSTNIIDTPLTSTLTIEALNTTATTTTTTTTTTTISIPTSITTSDCTPTTPTKNTKCKAESRIINKRKIKKVVTYKKRN